MNINTKNLQSRLIAPYISLTVLLFAYDRWVEGQAPGVGHVEFLRSVYAEDWLNGASMILAFVMGLGLFAVLTIYYAKILYKEVKKMKNL